MKIKSLFIAVLLMAGVFVAPTANASEKPTVESFTFSPQDIDLSQAKPTVQFELVVSHPKGIESVSTLLTLTNSRNDSFSAYLTRTDSNFASTRVVFKGAINLPRDTSPGVYTFTTSSIRNNPSAGYQFETGIIEGGKVRNLVGAESGVLVKLNGELNLDYETFVGPSYDSTLGVAYNDPLKFNLLNSPIWKVGETLDPTKYFELRVPGMPLSVSVTSPLAGSCTTDGKILQFTKEGTCSFIVSTPKTNDYNEKKINQSVTITSARIKPTLTLNKVSNQDVKDLGKSIDIGRVYSTADGYVLPLSATPATCLASGLFVKLISGGTCKVTYQTPPNSSFLESDLYTLSFEILKDGQPVVAPTPVVTPTPTPTAKPVVKRTISCVKGTKTIKRTAVSPKCPKGYKLKK